MRFLLLLVRGLSVCGASEVVDYMLWETKTQTVYDYSGNNNHAVNGASVSPAEASDVPFVTSGGNFSSIHCLTLPPNDFTSKKLTLGANFSMLFLIYYNSAAALTSLIEKYDSGTNKVLFGVYLDSTAVHTTVMGEDYKFTSMASKNQWLGLGVSVECTAGNCFVRVMKNGFTEKSWTSSQALVDNPDIPFLLGNSPVNKGFYGYLSEYRLFDSAMTLADMNNTFGRPTGCPDTCSVCSLRPTDPKNRCLELPFDAVDAADCTCPTQNCVVLAASQCLAVGADCHGTCASCAGPSDSDCLSCRYATDTLSSGKCQCPSPTASRDPTTFECSSCHSSCATCSGPAANECIDCKVHATGNSGVCSCDGGYYMDGSGNCGACDGTCVTCAGAGPGNCASCYIHAKLAGSSPNSCICDDGYYADPTTANCSVCDPTCATCSGSGPSSCQSCKVHASLSASAPSTCACSEGFYPNSSAENCAACDASCKSCSAPDTCASCRINADLVNGHCVCKPGATDCDICDSSCLTCSGGTASSCMTCRENAALDGGPPGACKCVERYFLDAGKCQPCEALCAVCTGAGPNMCSTCVSHASPLSGSPNTCGCDRGFFPSSSVCATCDSTCSACSASGASGCTDCHPNAELQGASPNTCVCSSGFYPSASSANCQTCLSVCLRCAGATDASCTACKPSAHLTSTAPSTCECDAGFYPSPDPSKCQPCHPDCKSCSDSTAASCSSCHPNAHLTAGTGSSCGCDEGFYGAAGKCQACDPTCKKCSAADSSACSDCYKNAHITGTAPATCQCSSTFYGSPDSRNCVACDATCGDCSGGSSHDCVTCKVHASLSGPSPNSCVCIEGFYPATDSSNCSACAIECLGCMGSGNSACISCKAHAALVGTSPSACKCMDGYVGTPENCKQCAGPCSTCSGTGVAECATCHSHASLSGPAPSSCTCDSGFFPDSTSCSPCHSNCITCAGPNSSDCNSCTAHSTLDGNAPSSCLCDSGFARSGTSCTACDSSCGTCSEVSASKCTACNSGAELQNTAPSACICSAEYYPDLTPANCSHCHATCWRCAGNSEKACTECKANAKLASSAPAPCVCEDGFYPSSTAASCASCHSSCGTCSGAAATDCTACKPPAALEVPGGPSACRCAGGMAITSSGLCVSCHSECKQCLGPGQSMCSECFDNAQMMGTPAACVCKSGFYPSPSSNSCQLCFSTCVTCSGPGPSDCLSCPAPSVLAGSAPSSCQCSAGYYGTAGACTPCDPICLTCSGATKDSCTSCRSNQKLKSASPSMCVCTDGFFLPLGDMNCAQCPRLCASCSSPNECCNCKDHSSLVSGTCQCNPGFYLFGETCKPCDLSCATCVNSLSSGCLTCKTGAVLSTSQAPTSCTCRNGYTLDVVTKNCLQSPCDIGCISCSASGMCGGCLKFAVLVQNKCQCNAGFYPNPDSANCSICDSQCITCVDGTNQGCTSCPPNAKLFQPENTKSTCVCMDGLFPDPDITKCSKCANGCRTCSKQDVCDSCPNGYKLTLVQKCKECSNCDSPLIAFASGPIDTDYNVTFNRFVPKNFTTEDFLLSTVPESNVTWELISMPTIRIYGGPWANITSVLIKFVTVVVNEFGVSLNNTELLVPPPTDPPSSHNDSFVNSTVATAATVAAGVIGGGAVVAGASVGGGSLAMGLLSQMQYFSYIGTANYSMTGSMNNFYVNLNQKSTLPNVFKRSNSDSAVRRLSDAENLIEVNDFLDSSGQHLTLLAGIVTCHFLFFVITRFFGMRLRCLYKLTNMFRYSVYLHFWYFSFLDLQVSALLQLKNTGFSTETTRVIICEILAVIVLSCTFTTPIILFFFIRNKAEQLFDPNENIWKQRFSPVVASLRTDVKWAKYLVPLYYFQRLLYSLFIVYMRGQQLKQALLLIVPCGLMAVFVILLRPMVLKTNRVLHIMAEVDTVLVFVLLCIATLQYNSPRIDICWIIVGFTLKSFLCTVAMVIIEVVVSIRSHCKKKPSDSSKIFVITTEGTDCKGETWADQTDLSFGGPAKCSEVKIYPFVEVLESRVSSAAQTRRSEESLA